MKCSKIQNLFVEEWAGTLDADSRDQLKLHLSECEACRKEWESLSQIWSTLEKIPDEEPGMDMRPRFYSMLHSYRHDVEKSRSAISHRAGPGEHPGRTIALQPVFQFALAAVLLLAGFLGGYFLKADRNGHEEIAGLRE